MQVKKEGGVKGILKFFSENPTLIVTLVLAVITLFYLIETRLIRKVAEKSFSFENSPIIFLEDIDFIQSLNDSKKEIEVTAVFKIKNAGKIQANDLKATYTFSAGTLKKEGKIEAPYLFPDQRVQYTTKILGWSLNEKNFAMAKEAQKKKITLVIPPEVTPPIFLDLNLRYIDQDKEEQNIPYRIKYTFHNNIWNFVIEEDKKKG